MIVICVPLQWLAVRWNWRLQTRIPRVFCRVVCSLLGIRPRFHGDASGRSPRIIVPNHVSWTDVLVLGCRQSPLRFLAKSEVAGWRLFGAIARLTGTIFVERQRRRSILHANAALCERLGKGEDVVLFAEGTTGDGNRLRRFNAPHFAAARDLLRARPPPAYLEIMPVAIAYPRRHGVPLGRLGRSGIAWYGDMELLPHLWDLVCRGGIECEVTYGAPIRFDQESDRKAVARQTEVAVRRLLNKSAAAPAEAAVASARQRASPLEARLTPI